MIAEMMLYVICADLVPAPLGETVEITVIPTLTAMRHGAIHALTTPALSLVTSDVLLMQTVGTHVTNVCKDYVKKLAVGLAVQIIEIVNLLLVTNVYVAFALSEVVAQSVKLVTIVLGKKIVLLVHLLRVEKKFVHLVVECLVPTINNVMVLTPIVGYAFMESVRFRMFVGLVVRIIQAAQGQDQHVKDATSRTRLVTLEAHVEILVRQMMIVIRPSLHVVGVEVDFVAVRSFS